MFIHQFNGNTEAKVSPHYEMKMKSSPLKMKFK